MILCSRSPDTFSRARNERLKVSGKPSQYNNLDIFINEQEEYRKEVSRSMLPYIVIDVFDDDFERV